MRPNPKIVLLFLVLAALPAVAQTPPPPPAPGAGELEPPLPEETGPAYAPPPPTAAAPLPQKTMPPPSPPTPATFEQSLSPYGRWVMTPQYGRVWTPANVGPDWQPYTDGTWVFTASGWTFASSVPWGWAAFHYGRWGFGDGIGWYWIPGYTWGPAWVSWRTSGTHIAWAPLAPAGFIYPRGYYGWVTVRSGDMTLALRPRIVPRASAVIVLRGARPGWGGAPMALRPEVRMRGYRAPAVRAKRDERPRRENKRALEEHRRG